MQYEGAFEQNNLFHKPSELWISHVIFGNHLFVNLPCGDVAIAPLSEEVRRRTTLHNADRNNLSNSPVVTQCKSKHRKQNCIHMNITLQNTILHTWNSLYGSLWLNTLEFSLYALPERTWLQHLPSFLWLRGKVDQYTKKCTTQII